MTTSTVPPAGKKQEPRRTWAGATAVIVSGAVGAVASGDLITVQTYPNEIQPRAWTASTARKALLLALDSLDSESHSVSIPLQITVQKSDAGDYVARFTAARISASGDSENEAVDMLKDMIIGRIEHLSAIPESDLGKVPRVQLRVLAKHIQSK